MAQRVIASTRVVNEELQSIDFLDRGGEHGRVRACCHMGLGPFWGTPSLQLNPCHSRMPISKACRVSDDWLGSRMCTS